MIVSFECNGSKRIEKLMNKIRSFDNSPKIETKNYIITKSTKRYKSCFTGEIFDGYTITINSNDWRYYCKDRKGHFKAVIEDLEWYLMARDKK